MRILILLSFLFWSIEAKALLPDVAYYRHLLAAANAGQEAAIVFYEQSKKIGTSSPAVLLGYRGMAELMMCKYVSNPLNKLSHFNKGKRLLQQAIEKDTANVELRFMRYCTQTNAPAMLDYNKNLKTDKKFLMNYLKQQSAFRKSEPALFEEIKSYLLTSKLITIEDKIALKGL